MNTWERLTLACAAAAVLGSQTVAACGDKYLLVGRGVRFEHAYAAIHPASILIVLPVKSVKSAAVRDTQLVTALKMAGHRVDVVQQPAGLSALLERSPHDIVLAEREDAAAIRGLPALGSRLKPSVVGVLEHPSPATVVQAYEELEFVLTTPQSMTQILNLMDDVMKARLESAHRAGANGS
jgi:hypothetical protein